MSSEDSDGLARLHQQGFVIFEHLEAADDCLEAVPAPSRSAAAAVDHQILRVVHQHPHRCFLAPSLARKLAPFRSTYRASLSHRSPSHRRASLPGL